MRALALPDIISAAAQPDGRETAPTVRVFVHDRALGGHPYEVPELPDVEGFRRLLAATAAGRRVTEVHVPAPDILRNSTPQALGRSLSGRRLGTPWRHGKWLFAPVTERSRSGPERAGRRHSDGGRLLIMHFGMDGSLSWCVPPSGYDRLVLRCDGGELRYRSVRKLGGVWLAEAAAAAEATGPLGPDALDLDADGLAAALAGARGKLKPALMDQRRVAGLGNLTVDEILWRARLHPAHPAGLPPEEVDRLHLAMREVLAGSVPVGRVPDDAGWLTRARAERTPACPRCGTPLARGRFAGRGTCWCPRCQS